MDLDELWDSPPVTPPASMVACLTGAAQRYLEHAIAADAIPAYAVRLRMHGEIKLKGWFPFAAEQVIHKDMGMIWQAVARCYGIPIHATDSCLGGKGATIVKALGLIPLVNATGDDIDRSAAGRANIETIWLPSLLGRKDVVWTSPEPLRAHASFTSYKESAEIDYMLDEGGALQSVSMPRWSNLNSPMFGYIAFGAAVDEERTFQGYTIPTKVRVGWQGDEFFRATIDDAVYR